MEIQKLILIDFTAALNGGIKKGSIDAILLSIEMIEKGFSSNSISKLDTATGYPRSDERRHSEMNASPYGYAFRSIK